MSRRIAVNRVHYPVEVLGPGTRVGIWVQGCDIGCAGCASVDTWDRADGTDLTVAELVAAVDRLVGDGACDGVTISGGEPLDQSEALVELIPALRERLSARAPGGEVDVLVYSGRRRSVVESSFGEVVALIDAFVPEPYAAGSGVGGRGRGSANQPLVTVSELGRRRFDPWVAAEAGTTMQLAVDDDGIWLIGLPRPDDLDRLDALMSDRGIDLLERSWRP